MMTFQALYRLEARSLLNCPVVGVAADHWSDNDLRKRAQESIEATEGRMDRDVFARLASRMSYLVGDVSTSTTARPNHPASPQPTSHVRVLARYTLDGRF
jgi:glucose-6-phosphate 1-dehydrogenase